MTPKASAPRCVVIRLPASPLLLSLFVALALGACVPAAPTTSAPRPVPSYIPETLDDLHVLLGEDLRPASRSLLDGIDSDLPIEANSWVEKELDFLVRERRDVLGSWMNRGDPYQPFITDVFREHGLPTDLYHIAMIESGFVPVARSRAGAVGMWQFMPATGREVGLRVDDVVDERMDPVRSTRAAARHLRSLYRIHGDWALAAAAYNAGSGRISRGLTNFGASNFWDLAQRGDLAAETRQYVPRLYAVTIVGRDRQRFGFTSPSPVEPFAFDSIFVETPIPLVDLARVGGVSTERLTALNPHLLRGAAPPGGYWVWVPAESGEHLQRAYLAAARQGNFVVATTGAAVSQEEAPVAPAENAEATLHTVRAGDTLWELARRYGVEIGEIQEANGLNGAAIRTGQTLRIPRPAGAGTEPIEHVVRAGDTLWGIAREYGSSIQQIQAANGLDDRPIIPGQRLTIPR
jgi:membrane-bound lytic murein transglycosylase D